MEIFARVRGALAVAALVALAPPAGAAGGCSSDTFSIDGAAVTVRICDAPGDDQVREIASVRGRPPLERTVSYARLEHQETARTIDDLPLGPLGIERTLHLTLAIRSDSIRLEHALLIPGAVALK